MRSISIRQFQQHLYEELKSLPFIVTRKTWKGKEGEKIREEEAAFVVMPCPPVEHEAIQELEKVVTPEPQIEPVIGSSEPSVPIQVTEVVEESSLDESMTAKIRNLFRR